MTRSVEELRRESERNREQLATTVERVREQMTDTAEDIRHKVSPQHIKSEVSDFISTKASSWVELAKTARKRESDAGDRGGHRYCSANSAARARLSAPIVDDWGRACLELEDCA